MAAGSSERRPDLPPSVLADLCGPICACHLCRPTCALPSCALRTRVSSPYDLATSCLPCVLPTLCLVCPVCCQPRVLPTPCLATPVPCGRARRASARNRCDAGPSRPAADRNCHRC